VTAYYLDRSGRHREFASFPREMADHPCWYSPARMLADRERLVHDGDELTKKLVDAAIQGHQVWLVVSEINEVDEYLFRPLQRSLTVDLSKSRDSLGVFCFTLRDRP
jgi:hypothetical protein